MSLQTFHSFEEVAADIKQFEGIAVGADESYKNYKFVRLYSETYETSLTSCDLLSQAIDRVDHFLSSGLFRLPVDIKIDPNKDVNVYAVIFDPETKIVQKFEHFGGFDSYDPGIFNKMNDFEFTSNLAVIHIASEKRIMTFQRNMQ